MNTAIVTEYIKCNSLFYTLILFIIYNIFDSNKTECCTFLVYVNYLFRNNNGWNYISADEDLWRVQIPLCRLCGEEIYDDNPFYIHETDSSGPTLADKINACLPVVVSKSFKSQFPLYYIVKVNIIVFQHFWL